MIGGLLTPLAGILPGSSAWGAPQDDQRPFTIDDYLNREEIRRASCSPDGSRIVIEVERRKQVGGSFRFQGLGNTACSDLIVLDVASGEIIWRTNGGAERISYYWPVWSPSGRELAYLAAGETGISWPIIHDFDSGRKRAFDRLGIVLSGLIRIPRAGQDTILAPFGWLNEGSLVAIARGDPTPDPLSPAYDVLATRNFGEFRRGSAKVTTWTNLAGRECDNRRMIVRIPPGAENAEQFAEGNFHGMSVSPQHDRAVLVSVVGRVPDPGGAILTAPAYVDPVHSDALLRWDISEFGFDGNSPRRFATGDGPVSASTLPFWSYDGRRIGYARIVGDALVNGGLEYSAAIYSPSDDRKWEFAARNGADAELIRSIFLAEAEPDRAAALMAERPALAEKSLLSGGIPSCVSLNSGLLVCADRDGVAALGSRVHGGRFNLPSSSLRSAISTADGGRIHVRGAELDTLVTFSSGARPRMSQFRKRLSGTSVDWQHNALFQFGNTANETEVFRKSRGQAKVLYRTNEHMAAVRKPTWVEVPYLIGGVSRVGVLYRPTSRPFDQNTAIIIIAYPGAREAPGTGSIGMTNSASSWLGQALLAAGFGVYIVDFRLGDAEAENWSPSQVVLDEVVPAVRALQAQFGTERRLGFYGHSLGGYTALVLGLRTSLFDAVISEAAFPDLVELANEVSPFYADSDCAVDQQLALDWISHGPQSFFRMAGTPGDNAGYYISNSPLYFPLSGVTTPILLIKGDRDASVRATESMYASLQRARVPAEFVRYAGESHVLVTPSAIRDSAHRKVEWFQRWLIKSG